MKETPRPHSGASRLRGRDLFRIVRPVLLGAEAVLRLLPRRLVAATWWMVAWVPGYPGVALRYVWARRLCRSCGENVYIGTNVEIRSWENLSIGSNVTIHRFYWIDAIGGVDIGDDVRLAHAGSLLSFEHSWNDPSRRMADQPLVLHRTCVGPDAIISAGVRVLAGAQIGERVVVAANAVVTRKGVLARGIYGGIPARLIKPLDSDVDYTTTGHGAMNP